MKRKVLMLAALSALVFLGYPIAVQAQQPQGPGPAAQQPPAPPPPLGGAVLRVKQGEIQDFVKDGVAVFRGLAYAARRFGRRTKMGEIRSPGRAAPAGRQNRPDREFDASRRRTLDWVEANLGK